MFSINCSNTGGNPTESTSLLKSAPSPSDYKLTCMGKLVTGVMATGWGVMIGKSSWSTYQCIQDLTATQENCSSNVMMLVGTLALGMWGFCVYRTVRNQIQTPSPSGHSKEKSHPKNDNKDSIV